MSVDKNKICFVLKEFDNIKKNSEKKRYYLIKDTSLSNIMEDLKNIQLELSKVDKMGKYLNVNNQVQEKTKNHPTSYCCDSNLIKICKERTKNDASESISLEYLMDQEGITKEDLKSIEIELNEIKDMHELIKDRKNSKSVELSFDELKVITENIPKIQSTEQILWGLIGDKCHPNNVLSIERCSQYTHKYKVEAINDSIGIVGDLQTEIHDENGNVNIDTYVIDTDNKTIHKVVNK